MLLHSGVSAYYIPGSPRDSYGDASRYGHLISSFPDVPFILAHMNMAKPEVVWDIGGKYDNLYVDTSFQSAARIRKAAHHLGTSRLLFASDFPFSLPRYALKAAMAATSDDPVFRNRLFHENAAGLLGLESF